MKCAVVIGAMTIAFVALLAANSPPAVGRPGPLVVSRIPWPPQAGPDAIGPAFPSLSGDCSLLAFAVAGEVYVRHLPTGPSVLVSVGLNGTRGNRPSGMPALSSDGTRIAFDSAATNLVPGPQNRHDHIFVRSVLGEETVRVSVNGSGELADDANLAFHGGLALSRVGSVVVFNSHASNLVPSDSNGRIDVFLRMLPNGPTVRASLSLSGEQGNGDSVSPAISGDGRHVVFASDSNNLVPDDTNSARDIFLRDRQTDRTVRLSASSDGAEANGASDAPTISVDGRFVAFSSEATNLAPGAPVALRSVFVLDRQSGKVEAVTAGLGPEERADFPALNGDGTRVAFVSQRLDAEHEAPAGFAGVFVLDRPSGAVLRLSAAQSGALANEESGGWGIALSADGACVSFTSLASNLVPDDDNNRSDLFLARLPAANPER